MICNEDGSTDNSAEILNKHKHEYDKIEEYKRKNAGFLFEKYLSCLIKWGHYGAFTIQKSL